MTLGDAAVGSTVVVTKITGDGAYKRRIMDMGITKGSELYIRKVAPLGDPHVHNTTFVSAITCDLSHYYSASNCCIT